MQPQSPENQQGVPASLPPVIPQNLAAVPQGSQPAAPQAPAGAGTISLEQYKLQAKQLVAQHLNNPYLLSNVLQQLKAQYLAQQFNVVVNPVEN